MHGEISKIEIQKLRRMKKENPSIEPYKLSLNKVVYLPKESVKSAYASTGTVNYLVLRIIRGENALRKSEPGIFSSWDESSLKAAIDESAAALEQAYSPDDLPEKRVKHAREALEDLLRIHDEYLSQRNIYADKNINSEYNFRDNIRNYGRALIVNQTFEGYEREGFFKRIFEESNRAMAVFHDFFVLNFSLKLHQKGGYSEYTLPQTAIDEVVNVLAEKAPIYLSEEMRLAELEQIGRDNRRSGLEGVYLPF